jgi:YVTN family beta-propeller protein
VRGTKLAGLLFVATLLAIDVAPSTGAGAETPCPSRQELLRRGYFSATTDGEQIIDTKSMKIIGEVKGLEFPSNTYVAANGREVFVDDWGRNAVVVVDACTRRIVDEIPVGGKMLGSLNPKGTLLYETLLPTGVVDPGPGKVFVIDTRAHKVTKTFDTSIKPVASMVSPDGQRVYVATLSTVATLDARTGEQIGDQISIPGIPGWLALTPDGKKLYTANLPSGISVIDTASNTLVTTIETPPSSAPQYIAAAPDGKTVWATYAGGGVPIVSTKTDEILEVLPTEGMAMTDSFSPDGKRIFIGEGGAATVNEDGFKAIVDSATGGWNPGPGNVTVYDVKSRKLLKRIARVGQFPGVVGIAGQYK